MEGRATRSRKKLVSGKGVAAIVVLIVVIGGSLYFFSVIPGSSDDPVTMIIDFTAWDSLAGSQDATTSAVDIYRMVDGNLVAQETVTMDAASKASALTYSSGEVLYLKYYDSTDTSVCTQYVKLTVPQADPSWIYDGAFQISLPFVDRGDTAKDILIQYHNNTAIANAATLDVTNESWDSNFAEIDFELRALNDDTGYINSYNFLRGYDNNHYIVLKATGTGWDSVVMVSGGWDIFDIGGSSRYFVKALDNDDVTRDKQSTGEYDPDGTLMLPMVFDFTGFESGDSVTFAYEYRWYSSVAKLKAESNWGVDTAATSESVTIQY